MKRVCKTYNLIGGVTAYHTTMSGERCLIQDRAASHNDIERTGFYFTASVKLSGVYQYGEWVLLNKDNNHYLFVWHNKEMQSVAVIELKDVLPTMQTQYLYQDGTSYEKMGLGVNCHSIQQFLLHLYENDAPKSDSLPFDTYHAMFKQYCKMWNVQFHIAIPLLPFHEIDDLNARQCSVFTDLYEWLEGCFTVWDIFLKEEPTEVV